MWNLEQPYNPISRFYRQRFGEKVYKISVATAGTCPNREGLRGMKVCNFCDQWGSAAYARNLGKPLLEQILEVKERVGRARGAHKFVVYFQAYTTTFASVKRLAQDFETALGVDDVVGIVVGTRPDCVSDGFIELIREYSEKTFLAVEMGVQSLDNKVLDWMRRGHTAESSLKALQRIRAGTTLVNLGIHLIFGSPDESDEDAKQTAIEINKWPVENVKLHHMHVLKGTPLEVEFEHGDFTPLDREAYFRRCAIFLQYLRPDISVHRLAALSSRWDELVAPAWTTDRMGNYQAMLDYLRKHNQFQGQLVNGAQM